MALKNNTTLVSLRNDVENSFKNIMNNDKIDLKEKKDEICKLMKIDNTNETIVFEFLKLQKEILSISKNELYLAESQEISTKSLKEILFQYECCVEEKKLNETFQLGKIAYIKRIMNTIYLIKDYKTKKELNEQIELLENLILEKVENFHNLIPINYNINLELYIYSVYYIFHERILNIYDNNFVNKNKIKDLIQKASIEKSKLLFQNKDKKNDERINILEKELKYIPYIYGTFNTYLRNISTFIKMTYQNFSKRFESNQLKDEKELLLFTDYMFFLSYYEFEDDASDYINIWNDTFVDLKLEDKNEIAKSFSIKGHIFKINSNALIVHNEKNGDDPYSINNLDDYSFIPLVNYLLKVNREPDLIELNKFLKVDRYMDKLYIKKIWIYWEQFLIKLFTSNVFKSLFYKYLENKYKEIKMTPDYFIDEDEIKIIINNIRYYIFKSDFHGITLVKNLSIYEDGDPYYIENNALLSKIAYLSDNIQSNLHEIIGHLNIRFQFYLSKDKRYSPPKPEKPSKAALSKKGKESREFIEELLFGDIRERLELEQMLYILDINNYQKDMKNFKEDFLKYGQTKGYNISPEFQEFLIHLEIDSGEINFQSEKQLCFINRYKTDLGNNKYGRHPTIGYDEIYKTINNY